jgi:hypothetical protein
MADPGDLTTLDSVKMYLGITANSVDDKLSPIITAVSAWIKSYLNRDVLQATYTETLNGTGGRQIMTANYPVTAVIQVLVDGVDMTAQAVCDGRRTISLMPPTSGTVWPSSSPWNAPTNFRRDIMNVVLKYTAGFAAAPFDLEHVACRIVAWGYNESSRLQQVSKSINGEVVAFSQLSIPNWAKDSLTNWKKVVG